MSYLEARWGLQLVAEEGYGRRFTAAAEDEDAAYAAAVQALTHGRTQ